MKIEEFKKKLLQKNEKLLVTITDPISSKKIKYSVSNNTTLGRAQSLFTKEPITIEWIRSFKKNAIFFDVGANVGMYSIFAAYVNDVNVYSFEPEANNFQILMENIIENNLIDKINAYPIGISNKSSFTDLYLEAFHKGGSHHMLGESLDHNLKPKKTKLKQGVFSTSLDELIKNWQLPIPNYLKIDVDGLEYKIIERADFLLNSENLQSILIEININRKEDKDIIKKLKKIGYKYNKEQVESSTRTSGKHIGYAEYLFFKS